MSHLQNLRNEFAVEHLPVDASIYWVLFSGAICLIFFNHGFFYLISFHVMVIIFRRYSNHRTRMWRWFYFFNNCSFENVISTVTQYKAKNSVLWSFVSWPQYNDYYGAKSFVNVAVPKCLKVICRRPCIFACNLVICILWKT